MRHLPMLLSALCLSLGCGSAPPAPAEYPPMDDGAAEPSAPATASPSADCPRAAALDLDALRTEVSCRLQQYVRLNTTNPPGNELPAAQYLAQVLQAEGIESQIIESAPGRANLIARLKGSGTAGALLLMHHMDVVPAVPDAWSVPPFEGILKDGAVWGRGSLDNKGGGVMGLTSLLMLKRLGITPPRDLIFLAVADEEAGGGAGARWLWQHKAELFKDVAFVLNEGGAILQMGPGESMYAVERAQKAPLWLKVTASGHGGHGSSPRPGAPSHVLARALGRVEAHRFPITVLPEVQAVFSARAMALPEGQRAPLQNLDKSLKRKAFAEEFLAKPQNAAMVRNTLSITMLKGSDKENVLPGTASAVFDLRLLPGQDPAAVTNEVIKVMAEPALKVETLLSWQAHASPTDTPLFDAITALAKQNDPHAPVTPSVLGGFTDCNVFRAHKVTCYGFAPMRIAMGDLKHIHAADERMDVSALGRAVLEMVQLVQLLK